MNPFTRYLRHLFRPGSQVPVVTWIIAALCVLVWLLQLLPWTGWITGRLEYWPMCTAYDPWQMLTSSFLHSPSNLWHILFNLYTLMVFGPLIEMWLGRGRFITLYLMSAFAGSVAVLWLAPNLSQIGGPAPVLGASGAIFGLLAATVVIQRGLGANPGQLVVMIVLNLAIGFFVSGIAWQAHVGGLIVGAAVAWIYSRNRGPRRRARAIWLTTAVGAALVVLTIAGATTRMHPEIGAALGIC